MSHIDRLTALFKEFPGIGSRQAKRFVYFLLTSKPFFVRELIDSIESLRGNFKQCALCSIFFDARGQETVISCTLCSDNERDKKTLIIVEKDVDVENIEASERYKGRYFVLGGLLPLFGAKNSALPRLVECLNTVRTYKQDGSLQEIIIALSVHPEGENTTMHLQKLFEPIIARSTIKVTCLGRGLSTGTELEYSDSQTIKNALE